MIQSIAPKRRGSLRRSVSRLSSLQVDVVVDSRRAVLGHDGEAPGHAEVHEQVAFVAIEEQVLAAPADREHFLAAQARGEVARDRPAQVRVAHDDIADPAAHHVGHEAAARRLDFGEFRHIREL